MGDILRILVIRLSSIGDIFHGFTILPDLKKVFPDATIDWLVDENFTEIAKLSPLIDNVIPIPLRKWKKNKLSLISKLIQYKKSLPNIEYDYIIDTQGLLKSALLAKFLFNGYVYGYDKKSARESLASLFYDFTYTVNQNDIAVVRFRGLIAKIFNLKHDLRQIDFRINSEDCEISYPQGYIVYLYGTSRDAKKWQLENWVTLSMWIIQNTTKQIILTYSNPQEKHFAEQIITKLSTDRVTLVNKLSPVKVVDLINKSDLVIGVDTGFTHCANLLGKATLAIYLDSNPNYVGMLESKIAHNLGGYQQQVSPATVIEYIQRLI